MSASSSGRRVGIIIGVIVLLGLGVLAWAAIRPGPLAFAGGKTVPLAQYNEHPTGVPADFTATDQLARGKYLTEAADCQACHTTEGGQPFAGGRAFATDFGTLYSPNITPDKETGIGDWSDADFLKALHEGVGKGGLRLYPAFPYAAYTYMTDEDALAIKAYLFTQPAVKNTAPQNQLSFPFDQRWLMGIWATMYDPNKRFEPHPDHSPEWNRGAYLVEALGHCGDCHTPRTPFQSLDNRKKFAGGNSEGWRAYNLSSDKESGIGTWSQEDLVRYLSTGHSMDRGSAFGPMAEAVHLSFAKMTPSDIKAIAEYVRSVPAVDSPDLPAPKAEPAPSDPSKGVAMDDNAKGREFFAGACAGCHGWSGANSLVTHATLVGTRAINDPSATNVALAVMRGAGPLPASNDLAVMPAFGSAYSDADIAAVSNYVTARFGAKGSRITAEDVRKLRESQ
ncbi:MAG TPA: c-type cytochrome [Steroidobacteraceae bacterium]